MKKMILIIIFLFSSEIFMQSFTSKEKIAEPTNYQTMLKFIKGITNNSKILKLNYLGVSYLGRKIPYVTISNSKDENNKVRFLIFAQQHGNEPSGKEALLLLLQEFSSGKHSKWLDKIEFIIVPQVSPDAAELGTRLTANNVDLNRSHVNLRNPEVLGLQKLFYETMPEVTLDIHETKYYGEKWLEWGYIKTARQNMGVVTNPNIAESILKFSKDRVFPFVENFVTSNGFSFSNYYLGNWYKGQSARFSNLGIYDGRQSLGIFNTLSFLIEGKNGKNINDNLTERRNGQLVNIKGLIEFLYNNASEAKETVTAARQELIKSQEGDEVIINSKFVSTDSSIQVVMHNVQMDKDTLMAIPFGGKVEATKVIKKPKGYLIPKYDHMLVNLIVNHHIDFEAYNLGENDKIYQYRIDADSIVNLKKDNSIIKKVEVADFNQNEFYYVPINQVASNFISLIFEPQSNDGVASKYGLLPDKEVSYYLNGNNNFNILRVETK